MKRVMHALLWPSLVMALAMAVGGCSSDNESNSNVQSDSYNNCFDSRTGMSIGGYGNYNGYGYGNGIYGNTGFGRNARTLTGRLETVSHLWNKFQMSLGICSDRVGPFQWEAASNCMQGPPMITVMINDMTFSGPGRSSLGGIMFGAANMGGYSAPQMQTTWNLGNNNGVIASSQISTFGDRAGNLQVILDPLSGAVTANNLRVIVRWANQEIGQGIVCVNGRCQ